MQSEPGAGLTGLVYAVQQAAATVAVPILHLQRVNPYVGSAMLSTSTAGGTALAMPRVAAPLQLAAGSHPANASSEHNKLALGVSSFAFQVGASTHACAP